MDEPVELVLNEKDDGTFSIDDAPEIAAFPAEMIYKLAAGEVLGIAISASGVKFFASNGVFEYVFRAVNEFNTNAIIGDLVKE